jgi:recombination protein RecA
VKVVKNKCAVPFREAEFDIRWGMGIDAETDLLDYGLQLGVVEKNGSHLSFAGEQLGQGRERARDTIVRGAVGGALRSAVEAAAPVHRARVVEMAAAA